MKTKSEERAGAPRRPIRLIALDVDGTLLDDQKRLPPANLEALRRARERGVEVAIASGRMMGSIEPIERLLDMDCSVIAYNGGKIMSTRARGRVCLLHRPLDAETAARLIDFSRQHGHLLNWYHDDRLYAEDSPRRRQFMAIYSGRTGAVYNPIDLDRFRGQTPTKLILLAEPAERDRLYDRFHVELDGRVNVTKSDPEYLEFMARDVDKGNALPILAEHLAISTEEILAMGDADNDRLLLSRAGLGVAVANASEPVKAAARRVTARTNNEGAVAEAVERWVLGSDAW